MELLRSLPEEYLLPLFPCFGLLRNNNLVLFDDRSGFRRVFPYFYILPSIIGFHMALTIYLIEGFQRGMDLDELVFVVPVYVVSTQSIFKALIVVSNIKGIRSLIVRLGGVWRTTGLSDQQISKKNVLLKRLKFCYTGGLETKYFSEKATLCTILIDSLMYLYFVVVIKNLAFYWMNIIGSWQYIMAPMLETLFRKYILQQETSFQLPFGCYLPFDPSEEWKAYLPAYFFEAYGMFRMIYYYLGTEFLMITLCSHLGTEFTLLHQDLLHLKPSSESVTHFNEMDAKCRNTSLDGNNDELDRICLSDLIRRHQILIGLSQDLDEIFNKMIFVNLSSASITICFFGFSAKVARDAVSLLNNFIGVIASMLPIFNLCYYAELLKESSEGVSRAAYENLWYKGTKNYKKAILFIIKRSQKPCTLTSLKYNPIALSTFTTVMSTTWSYFSLASSVYDENGEKGI